VCGLVLAGIAPPLSGRTTMPPLPRYTYQHHAVTGSWYVYDGLLDRTVRIENSGVAVAHLARDYEADWRRHCERWMEAEHRKSLP